MPEGTVMKVPAPSGSLEGQEVQSCNHKKPSDFARNQTAFSAPQGSGMWVGRHGGIRGRPP